MAWLTKWHYVEEEFNSGMSNDLYYCVKLGILYILIYFKNKLQYYKCSGKALNSQDHKGYIIIIMNIFTGCRAGIVGYTMIPELF